MKRTCLMIVLAGAVAVLAGTAHGGEGSVEEGMRLFNDQALGGSTNQTSCSTCHPGGRGLENAGGKENLLQMINMCIENPLQGKGLEEDSPEMDSLAEYIKSLKQ